ncbi:MAG: hypothetical protein M1812_001215 [Candelaria pacifica]|nr:MAG: hypothetical protein M1812_001215 [Candelaria pacifica]
MFCNKLGQRLKEIKCDTRFRRRELSAEGARLAGRQPFLIRNGSRKELVIHAPEQVKDFYQHDAQNHVKPAGLNFGHFFERILGQSVGIASTHKWRAMRAHFNPEFSHSAATNLTSTFTKEVKAWMDELPKNPAVVAQGGDKFVVDAATACKILPFRLVAIACYGDMLTDETFKQLLSFNKIHEKLMGQAVFGKLTCSKLYGMLPTKAKKQMDRYEKEWRDFNIDIVKNARETDTRCPAEKIYAGFELSPEVSEAEFLETIDEILFTNIDVTSAVLAFVLINLAANSAFQEKLRSEIRHERASSAGGALGSYFAKDDTLLHWAGQESIRMSPAAWFSLPECTAIPKTIGGYRIPAGTPVVIDWRRLNSESEVWGSDGHQFRPERYAEISSSQYRYSLLRFGIGPRKCLGKNMADLITKLTIVTVLEGYRLSGVMGNVVLRKDRFTCTPQQLLQFNSLSKAS